MKEKILAFGSWFIGLVSAFAMVAALVFACAGPQKVQAVNVSLLACRLLLEQDELVQQSAQLAGVPLDRYLDSLCQSFDAVAPLLRTARALKGISERPQVCGFAGGAGQ